MDIAQAKAGLSKEAAELYKETLDLGGIELHKEQRGISNVKELIDAKLVEFGPTRGPGGAWSRMWAVEDEDRV